MAESSDVSGLSGLINLGNSCWFNSIIQCISNTEPIRNYLLTGKYRDDADANKDTFLFLEIFVQLLSKLWSNNGIVEPKAFRDIIAAHNGDYRAPIQHCAHDFISFLNNKLHDSLCYEATISISGTVKNNLDKKAVASIKSWGQFFKNEYSFFIELTNGQFDSHIKCSKCGKSSHCYEPFGDLSLPIGKDSTTLYDCFDELTSQETLGNDNKWKCDKCNEFNMPKKKLHIWKVPDILIITLKRFNNDLVKNNKPISYPVEGLDLKKYTNGYEKYNAIYDLYAICIHTGRYNFGHYYSYCKHHVNDKWYEFNDTNVSELNESDIVNDNAYILFYQKRD